MKLGVYRLHEVLEEGAVSAIEKAWGRPIHLVSVYRAWNDCDLSADLAWLTRLKTSCRDLMLTWEPWRLPGNDRPPQNQPDYSLLQILSGRYDGYIRAFFKALCDFPQPLYLRPMHEMNGNWYPWCGQVNGNTPALFVKAWQYLRTLVADCAAPNIRWVWSPYAFSYPPGPDNDMACYFPGDDAVDWIALDGYNWGTCRPDSTWQSFEEIFEEAYRTVAALSRRPLMIAETACSDTGGDKGKWIRQAFHLLPLRFPRVEMLVWFDEKKECDWRMIP